MERDSKVTDMHTCSLSLESADRNKKERIGLLPGVVAALENNRFAVSCPNHPGMATLVAVILLSSTLPVTVAFLPAKWLITANLPSRV